MQKDQDLEKKLTLSLDDLIAQQRQNAKKKSTPAAGKRGPAGKGAPKYVPIKLPPTEQGNPRQGGRRNSLGNAGAVNKVRGGVRKSQGVGRSSRPVPLSVRAAQRKQPSPSAARPRNMKIVISNSRPPTQPPPDFLAGSRSSRGPSGSSRGPSGSSFAPMIVGDDFRRGGGGGEGPRSAGPAAPPPGNSLSSRFDRLGAGGAGGRDNAPRIAGAAPPARPAMGPPGQRRNAHGVLLP